MTSAFRTTGCVTSCGSATVLLWSFGAFPSASSFPPCFPHPFFFLISFSFFSFSLPHSFSLLCYQKYLYPKHLCGLSLAGIPNDVIKMTLALPALETTYFEVTWSAASPQTLQVENCKCLPLLITQALPGCKRREASQFSLDMWFPRCLSLPGQAGLWQ